MTPREEIVAAVALALHSANCPLDDHVGHVTQTDRANAEIAVTTVARVLASDEAGA